MFRDRNLLPSSGEVFVVRTALKQIKSLAYSSQGSHTGQLDFCNWHIIIITIIIIILLLLLFCHNRDLN